MDVELLFSRNPFVQQFGGQFSSIRPNQSQTIELKPAARTQQKSTTIPLPEQLHNSNVLVEIVGGGQTKTQAYYAHSLAVQIDRELRPGEGHARDAAASRCRRPT